VPHRLLTKSNVHVKEIGLLKRENMLVFLRSLLSIMKMYGDSLMELQALWGWCIVVFRTISSFSFKV
jgi:hypothetical protein